MSRDGSASAGGQAIVVDGHVHWHPEHDLTRWLDAAAANLARAARRLSAPTARPVLALTQSAGASDPADWPAPGGAWTLEPASGEPGAPVVARRAGHAAPAIVLLPGRQIACREGLEILALGWPGTPPPADGSPIESVIRAVDEAGALPLVPWGFGKWVGRRARLASRLLRESADGRLPPIGLGDLGDRPPLPAGTAPFALARRLGRPIIPGSDPLPFPRHERRAGVTAIRLVLPPGTGDGDGDRDEGAHANGAGAAGVPSRPALVAALAGAPADAAVHREGVHPLRFVRDQWAMQTLKRRRPPAAAPAAAADTTASR